MEQPVHIVKLHYDGAGLTCKADRPVSTIYILPGSRSGFTATQQAADPEPEQSPAAVSEDQAGPADEITKTPPVYTADPFAQPAQQTKKRKKLKAGKLILIKS